MFILFLTAQWFGNERSVLSFEQLTSSGDGGEGKGREKGSRGLFCYVNLMILKGQSKDINGNQNKELIHLFIFKFLTSLWFGNERSVLSFEQLTSSGEGGEGKGGGKQGALLSRQFDDENRGLIPKLKQLRYGLNIS